MAKGDIGELRRPLMYRSCLNCGRLFTGRGPRCPEHARQHERTRRPSTAQRGYGAAWQRQSRAAIAAHRAEYGDWCPGYGVPPHASTDLVADHLVDGDASLVVVGCRACNTRKRASHGDGGWGRDANR